MGNKCIKKAIDNDNYIFETTEIGTGKIIKIVHHNINDDSSHITDRYYFGVINSRSYFKYHVGRYVLHRDLQPAVIRYDENGKWEAEFYWDNGVRLSDESVEHVKKEFKIKKRKDILNTIKNEGKDIDKSRNPNNYVNYRVI